MSLLSLGARVDMGDLGEARLAKVGSVAEKKKQATRLWPRDPVPGYPP